MGSDSVKSMVVLDSPTVDGLHARVFQSFDGEYLLADTGSIAGTWLNYAPVSTQGAHLQHGDLIHIGRMAFRFELRNASGLRQPQVMPYDGE